MWAAPGEWRLGGLSCSHLHTFAWTPPMLDSSGWLPAKVQKRQYTERMTWRGELSLVMLQIDNAQALRFGSRFRYDTKQTTYREKPTWRGTQFKDVTTMTIHKAWCLDSVSYDMKETIYRERMTWRLNSDWWCYNYDNTQALDLGSVTISKR